MPRSALAWRRDIEHKDVVQYMLRNLNSIIYRSGGVKKKNFLDVLPPSRSRYSLISLPK